MLTIKVHKAQTKLSEYLAEVEAGETVVICRHNVPNRQASKEPRPIGLACDRAYETLPGDMLKAFNGELPDPLITRYPVMTRW